MSRNIQIREITSLCALRRVEPEWNALWERCREATVFQSPDWLTPWVEAFAPSRLWVLELRERGTLIGLAPLFIYGTGGDRIVAPLGAGISDYLDVLVAPEFPEAVDALAEFLQEQAWTELHFPDLRESSVLLRPEFLVRFNHGYFEWGRPKTREICPQLDLPTTADALRTVVPAKQLRNLRVARRSLDGASVELATDATLDEFLTALFRLHEKRWQRSGQSVVLADSQVRELYRRAAPRLMKRGVLRLFGLRYGSELIACLMAFSDRDAMRLYMQGYDPDWARSSPGAQLVGAALEQAIREGKKAADFMRGREVYKYYWGCRDIPTFELQIAAARYSGRPIPEKSAA